MTKKNNFWITQHKVENEAKLLKQTEKPLELTILEKIFIQKKQTFSILIYLMKNI